MENEVQSEFEIKVDKVKRLEEMGEKVTAVATGGLMGIVLPFCKHKIYYDENLLLVGLLKLYEKNKH